MTLRQSIRRIVGDALYAKLQIRRRNYANQRFAAVQTDKEIRIGNFVLTAPSNHILFRYLPSQPYRDLAVGIIARELAHKYPGQPLVDIGANIGDTMAIMATHSPSPIILVEPSEFYGRFLRENASRIPNSTSIHQVMVSGKQREQGVLMHAGGTARFETVAEGPSIECKKLAEIVDGQSCMIKIDADGFDLPILAGSFEYLAERLPCLFYENEVLDTDTLAAADQVVSGLAAVGYRYFAIFEDTGLHMFSTTDVGVVRNLNRYLYKVRTAPVEREFYCDVFCVSPRDQDVFFAVTEYFGQS
jgi:FkbM family methyltransferase